MKVYVLSECYQDVNGDRATILGVYADKTAADLERIRLTEECEADKAKQPYDHEDPPQFRYSYGVEEFEAIK